MKVGEQFTSRWGLIVSVIGIAVGTGNIWRFPRIAAANGGGSFLLPWIVSLFLWSTPLIMTEFAIGKLTRYDPIGSFAVMMGKKLVIIYLIKLSEVDSMGGCVNCGPYCAASIASLPGLSDWSDWLECEMTVRSGWRNGYPC